MNHLDSDPTEESATDERYAFKALSMTPVAFNKQHEALKEDIVSFVSGRSSWSFFYITFVAQ